MKHDPIVIAGFARTPIGAFQGDLKNVSATRLGAIAIRGAVERAGVALDAASEVLMGNCLSAGLGQAPARQAALGAGLSITTGSTTLSKMCGSGMKAVMLAHDLLLAGSAKVAVAGGMESMTNAPYLVAKARAGLRLGHAELKDHMFFDGLEDAYEPGRLMGSFAEDSAAAYGFDRAQQDAFAAESLSRARSAIATGAFRSESVPVDLGGSVAQPVITDDEMPQKASLDKLRTLKPAFRKDGTITAANASSISDGAAALVLTRLSTAERLGLPVRASIVAHATYAHAPNQFATAPVPALRTVMEKTGWRTTEVDLFEINEAFAVVTMIAMKDLGLAHDVVNIHGGACALGHPIGATGARIIVTLLGALERHNLKRGIAGLCIGGGEATALAVERL
ncbi:acetyl-CoA C-acyltransferase [Cupriavidus sp. BIC8F]|uniref:acetyl-CoA C-acyltransferase n=1 Tax=Cupriavidus sp. BIC8F TaxID=3079014 RepID=UPI002916FABD|nr:acetyl-CoA C-acyltransferase [Cupriavidus sp. BIC8F]